MNEPRASERLHISVAANAVGTLGRSESRQDSVFSYAENAAERNAREATRLHNTTSKSLTATHPETAPASSRSSA
jgi:hypothetical protein